jgi:hypothetical protein
MKLARVLTFALVVMALPLISVPVRADDVPESLRLERQAEKAYGQSPVVPIDRPNAHHRNLGADDPTDPADDLPVAPDEAPTPTPPAPDSNQQSK